MAPIKVLDSNKKGACHKGYYRPATRWVYHSPLYNTVLFDYQPTRAEKATLEMLKNFRGYLQSDGYSVYKKIAKRPEVTHLVCWPHARREFEKALSNDQAKAQIALTLIQQLYVVEAQARERKSLLRKSEKNCGWKKLCLSLTHWASGFAKP